MQLQRMIVLAQQLVDDSQVATGSTLADLVARRQRHFQLLLVPLLRLIVVASASSGVAETSVSSVVEARLEPSVVDLRGDLQHVLVINDRLGKVAFVVKARSEIAVSFRRLDLIVELLG